MNKILVSLCGSVLVSSVILAAPASASPQAAVTAGTGNMAQQVAVSEQAPISGGSVQSASGSSFWSSIVTSRYADVAALPGFSLVSPTGLVPGWGTVFYGAGLTTNSTTNGGIDGGISLGMGYGDPYDSLGGAITLGLASVNPKEIGKEFGNAAYYSINTGHFFVDQQIGVSVGMSNFAGWLPTGAVGAPSYYVAGTKVFSLPDHPIIITGGLGNQNYSDYRNTNKAEPYPFISGAYYIAPQLSFVVDYTSAITSTGFSLVPVYYIPVVVNLGIYDLFHYIPNHTRPSIMMGVSSAFTF